MTKTLVFAALMLGALPAMADTVQCVGSSPTRGNLVIIAKSGNGPTKVTIQDDSDIFGGNVLASYTATRAMTITPFKDVYSSQENKGFLMEVGAKDTTLAGDPQIGLALVGAWDEVITVECQTRHSFE